MDEMSNFITNVGKIFKILSYGLEKMAEKACEMDKISEKKEVITEEQSIKEVPVQPQVAQEVTPKPEKKLKKKNDKKNIKGKKPSEKSSAMTKIDVILDILNNSDKPISTASIEKKTGFGHRSVLDVLYGLKKRGKIKRVSQGLYIKA